MKYNILNVNVNGINTLIPKIHLLLTSHRPVIAILTDTRLKGAPWFYFEGYKLYHTLTPDMAGGIIILVRADVPSRLTSPTLQSLSPFWYSVSVEVNLNTPFVITGIYRRPNDIIHPFIGRVKHFISRKSHLVIGDLNAKHPLWGNKTSNPMGNWLASQHVSVSFM
jgi:hypothetical protein